MSVYAYTRVSTQSQQTDSQTLEILQYANRNDLKINYSFDVISSTTKSFKERRITELLETLKTGDTLILYELSRIARSVSEVAKLLGTFKEKSIHFIVLKQNLNINFSQQIDPTNKILLTVFSMIAELERDMICERTKSGLRRAISEGKKLGRPKGKYSSSLDKYKDKIIEQYQLGVSKLHISRNLNLNYHTLLTYMNKLNIKKEEVINDCA